MMDKPFEVGGQYRNRNAAYEVLALADEYMTILYENGRVQTVGIRMQARIWANIQIDETPTPQPKSRIDKEDEGQDSWPIQELTEDVLQTFRAPHPADVIDQVFVAIENNPAWLARYENLVEHYSSQGKYGKMTVNSMIGRFTKDLTGMVTLQADNVSQNSLTKSFSTLVYAGQAQV
ncbi:MAG: hypothetical protein KDE56_02025 [Anaerolineales bacterium]|nr:hypothetical protein [Anaerolineales bacterium]